MKTQLLNGSKILGGLLVLLLCTTHDLSAQQRPGGGAGGGGGGFGGFGGFGGGGFGGGNRGASGSTSGGSYNNNGTVGSAVISVDPQTHNIIVIADDETSGQISNVIHSLDAPMPQVLIKVVFLEVSHNDASEIGVQGDYTGFSKKFSQFTGYITNYSIGSGGSNGVSIVPSSLTPVNSSYTLGNNFGLPQSLAGASGSGGLYQILGNDFTATIQAIAAAGKSQVLSRPSILARDGQLAKIVVGQEIYLPNGVAFTTTGNTTTPVINGTYTDVGIILNVTPFIGANGLVEMIVQPQTSTVDTSSPGQQIASGGLLGTTPVFAPNINIRSADTVVVTPDSQTVVIGGLIGKDKSSSVSKVPLLGDIPLLGALFRSTTKAEQQSELLIFLTPHIIQSPTQLAGMSTREMGQSPLITNSVSEQELDRFLERVPVKKNK